MLVTGFDIIFFWVARMMMMGLHFMDEVPFRDVYIHALVRDEKGQKMSKSKGNVIDPLDLIDNYGADALALHAGRHGGARARHQAQLLARRGLSQFRDQAVERRALRRDQQLRAAEPTSIRPPPRSRSIAGSPARASGPLAAVTEALQGFRFNEAAGAIYHFIWHVYCDWYLELIKPILAGADEDAAAETRAMAAFVLDQALKLLHPFMPFVTEELWVKRAPEAGRASLLMLAPWPEHRGLENAEADAEIGWLIRFISEVRSVRAEMNVPAGAKVPLVISGASDETRARVARHEETLLRLARLERIEFGAPPHGAVQIVLDEAVLALPLAGIIDIDAEQKRLKREIDKVGSEIRQLDAKLGNEKFVSRAPEHVVEEQRERKSEAEATAAKLEQALKRLEAAL